MSNESKDHVGIHIGPTIETMSDVADDIIKIMSVIPEGSRTSGLGKEALRCYQGCVKVENVTIQNCTIGVTEGETDGKLEVTEGQTDSKLEVIGDYDALALDDLKTPFRKSTKGDA